MNEAELDALEQRLNLIPGGLTPQVLHTLYGQGRITEAQQNALSRRLHARNLARRSATALAGPQPERRSLPDTGPGAEFMAGAAERFAGGEPQVATQPTTSSEDFINAQIRNYRLDPSAIRFNQLKYDIGRVQDTPLRTFFLQKLATLPAPNRLAKTDTPEERSLQVNDTPPPRFLPQTGPRPLGQPTPGATLPQAMGQVGGDALLLAGAMGASQAALTMAGPEMSAFMAAPSKWLATQAAMFVAPVVAGRLAASAVGLPWGDEEDPFAYRVVKGAVQFPGMLSVAAALNKKGGTPQEQVKRTEMAVLADLGAMSIGLALMTRVGIGELPIYRGVTATQSFRNWQMVLSGGTRRGVSETELAFLRGREKEAGEITKNVLTRWLQAGDATLPLELQPSALGLISGAYAGEARRMLVPAYRANLGLTEEQAIQAANAALRGIQAEGQASFTIGPVRLPRVRLENWMAHVGPVGQPRLAPEVVTPQARITSALRGAKSTGAAAEEANALFFGRGSVVKLKQQAQTAIAEAEAAGREVPESWRAIASWDPERVQQTLAESYSLQEMREMMEAAPGTPRKDLFAAIGRFFVPGEGVPATEQPAVRAILDSAKGESLAYEDVVKDIFSGTDPEMQLAMREYTEAVFANRLARMAKLPGIPYRQRVAGVSRVLRGDDDRVEITLGKSRQLMSFFDRLMEQDEVRVQTQLLASTRDPNGSLRWQMRRSVRSTLSESGITAGSRDVNDVAGMLLSGKQVSDLDLGLALNKYAIPADELPFWPAGGRVHPNAAALVPKLRKAAEEAQGLQGGSMRGMLESFGSLGPGYTPVQVAPGEDVAAGLAGQYAPGPQQSFEKHRQRSFLEDLLDGIRVEPSLKASTMGRLRADVEAQRRWGLEEFGRLYGFDPLQLPREEQVKYLLLGKSAGLVEAGTMRGWLQDVPAEAMKANSQFARQARQLISEPAARALASPVHEWASSEIAKVWHEVASLWRGPAIMRLGFYPMQAWDNLAAGWLSQNPLITKDSRQAYRAITLRAIRNLETLEPRTMVEETALGIRKWIRGQARDDDKMLMEAIDALERANLIQRGAPALLREASEEGAIKRVLTEYLPGRLGRRGASAATGAVMGAAVGGGVAGPAGAAAGAAVGGAVGAATGNLGNIVSRGIREYEIVLEANYHMAGLLDDAVKVSSFLNAKAAGFSTPDAISFVNQGSVSYGRSLRPMFDRVCSEGFFFWTWFRQRSEQLIHTSLRRPGVPIAVEATLDLWHKGASGPFSPLHQEPVDDRLQWVLDKGGPDYTTHMIPVAGNSLLSRAPFISDMIPTEAMRQKFGETVLFVNPSGFYSDQVSDLGRVARTPGREFMRRLFPLFQVAFGQRKATVKNLMPGGPTFARGWGPILEYMTPGTSGFTPDWLKSEINAWNKKNPGVPYELDEADEDRMRAELIGALVSRMGVSAQWVNVDAAYNKLTIREMQELNALRADHGEPPLEFKDWSAAARREWTKQTNTEAPAPRRRTNPDEQP